MKKLIRKGLNRLYDRGYSCGNGVGPLYKINGIMDRFMYSEVLENVMFPYAEWNMAVL